jgi:hypothetical protein
MLRKFLGLSCLCLSFSAFAPRANAAFVWFVVNGPNNTQATVAEQIVCIANCNGARTLDYQYYVFNTGLNPIDGFSLGVGNRAQALAGGEQYSDLANGADGAFPNATGGGLAGNAIGFLTVPGVNPPLVSAQQPGEAITAFQTQAPNTVDISNPAIGGNNGWGFEEFDNFTNAVVPPAQNAYVVRWYTQVQGGAGRQTLYNPGCNGNTPIANGANQPLNNTSGVLNTFLNCNGFIYFAAFRVDLFSTRNPAPGTGAPDPCCAWDLGIDADIGGLDTFVDAGDPGVDNSVCTQGVDCSTIDPGNDGFDSAQSLAPEPATAALIGGALIGLGCLLRRKRRLP